mmetsp:Transcript_14531/g.35573  ORF Transcript_14531/g.35573 Transcript_14531/m.35573 type:complete len:273 (+) Transcript_14531:425-1243(+)
MLRERQDARKVVVVRRLLLLRKIPHDMEPLLVVLAHDVKQERVDVVVKVLVVKKHLRDVAQVLTPDLRLLAVDLEHGNVPIPVDLVARRVPDRDLLLVPLQLLLGLVEGERELADVQQIDHLVAHLPDLPRQRCKVPCLHNVPPELDLVHVLNLGELLVLLEVSLPHALVVLVILVCEIIPLVLPLPHVSELLACRVEIDPFPRDPRVEPAVEIDPVHIKERIVFLLFDDYDLPPVVCLRPPQRQDVVPNLELACLRLSALHPLDVHRRWRA